MPNPGRLDFASVAHDPGKVILHGGENGGERKGNEILRVFNVFRNSPNSIKVRAKDTGLAK